MKKIYLTLFILVFIGLNFGTVSAQTTTFTYQGKLNDNGLAANANFDMQFKLFGTGAGGSQIGATLSVPNVAVASGIFTVRLDFGANFDGTDRFLEIALKPAGSPNPYTVLAPRQPVTSTPYAIQSMNAANAVNATNAANAQTSENSLRLGGTLAADYVQTTDARMTDARTPLAGSPDYVQNTQTPQANANFNVEGNGTVGGTLSGNTVNAGQGFNFGGARVFFKNGTANLFAGFNAGSAVTGGTNNSFFGDDAGAGNDDGAFNSFFGNGAGQNNQVGAFNSFFGWQAGQSNTIANKNSFFGSQAGKNNLVGSNSFFGYQAGLATNTGSGNSFFGQEAGKNNTTGRFNVFIGATTGGANITGSNNTLIGQGANFSAGADNLDFATALGSGATVGTSNTVVLGRSLDAVKVPGDLAVTGSLSADGGNLTNLNAGNITNGVLSAANGGTGLSSSGEAGKFLRSNGSVWTSAAIQSADLPDLSANYIKNSDSQQNASFNVSGNGTVGGTLSANSIVSAADYFINNSRVLSTTGSGNLFVGAATGTSNSGSNNSFVGGGAGFSNTVGANNSFFGRNSGLLNIAGSDNAFFGYAAGEFNTAGSNSFFGSSAGRQNTGGANNAFFGTQSGMNNVTGNDNSFFGVNTGMANVRDGNSFFGKNSGMATSLGNRNSFFGAFTGELNTTGFNNAFFGWDSGGVNTTGDGNSFFGYLAGWHNTLGGNNTTVGAVSGRDLTTESNNTLIGFNANIAPGVTDSTAIGANAVVTASNQIVLGTNLDSVRIPGLLGGGSNHLCFSANNVLQGCSSSLRYKTNFAPYTRSLDVIDQLRPISFDWKSDGTRDLGFGAEDVAKIDPLLVTYNARGEVEGVKYERLSTVFVNAFKEQQTQIKDQQTALAKQQEIIKKQENELRQQQSELTLVQKRLDELTATIRRLRPVAAVNKSATTVKKQKRRARK